MRHVAMIPLAALQEIPSAAAQTYTFDELWASALPTLLKVLLVFVLAAACMRASRGWLAGAMTRARVEVDTRILVLRLVTSGILVVALLIVLNVVGVSPATLITLVGAVGLAFSLAAQDILKNFFSGLYLLLERPFRVGDSIRVKDFSGRVIHVGVRTTTLQTDEQVEILVPNAVVFAEVVSNISRAVPKPPAELPSATPVQPLPENRR